MQISNQTDYFELLLKLYKKIDFEYDAIVALKRSGWMMGAYYSNLSIKPVFTESEINSIPEKFKRILIVDDKICKGKAIRKVFNLLEKKGKIIKTACIFIEGEKLSDFYEIDLNNKKIKMWYEVSFNSALIKAKEMI